MNERENMNIEPDKRVNEIGQLKKITEWILACIKNIEDERWDESLNDNKRSYYYGLANAHAHFLARVRQALEEIIPVPDVFGLDEPERRDE